MIFKTSISHFIFRLESDCAEMVHAARGLDIMWHYRPITDVVYNHEDLTSCPLRTGSSLAQSGLCPCLLVNIGSAMTIVSVSRGSVRLGGVSKLPAPFKPLSLLSFVSQSFLATFIAPFIINFLLAPCSRFKDT